MVAVTPAVPITAPISAPSGRTCANASAHHARERNKRSAEERIPQHSIGVSKIARPPASASCRPRAPGYFERVAAIRRLVLFDIDGTLLSAGGAPRRAFRRALVEHFGTEGAAASDDFSGKTDPQIVHDLMRAVGFAEEEVEERITDFFAFYLEELEHELAVETQHRLYPGVAELVPALAADPAVALGLLTGNIEAGARLKLSHFGLWQHFSVGAYGSDDRTRDRLGPVALARARARFGRSFEGSEVVIVGDTPADVRCAHAIGAVAVAVATGRPSRETLEAAGADVLLDSLAEWPAFHDSLTGPVPEAGRRPWNRSAY